MNGATPNDLLEPIPGDDIGGTDLAFSTEFDEIREARRQDDPSLTQGAWETERKTAQWPRVRELAETILREQSKDLQVAAWYSEAMTRLKGFEGLTAGLTVLEGLLNDFWEFCYPVYDSSDLDERAGKIEWLNRQLPLVVRDIPLTDRASGGYAWLKWEESRATDNLGLKDAAAREKALADGKLSGELFDKAVHSSGRAFYEALHPRIQAAGGAMAALERRVAERFGQDAPSLTELRHAIADCDELVGKLLVRLGGQAGREIMQAAPVTELHAEEAPQAVMPTMLSTGPIHTRGDAIKALRAVSHYFRQHEPHSPVAFLAERAANWAEMSLGEWLSEVVKDEGTLRQLRELLDVRAAQ
ncbi:MAG: type VI secretion system protein TssA [Zoogloea sp.]|nr:type VI secretion system protein TssA [Zoogloea sp.]